MPEQESKIASGVGFGCVTLFALPFAGFGTFMAWQLVSTLWLAVETRSWVETPAQIQSVELKSFSDSEGGSTYKVVAEYEYEYDGRRYEADRVGLTTEADNLRRYHKRLFDRIKRARDGLAPSICYVDPSNPARSVLDREFRPLTVVFYLPFALGFSFVGYGLVVGVIYAARLVKHAARLKAAEPEKPWLWREDWKRGVVESTSWERLIAAAIGAFLWNCLAWPIAIIMWSGDSGAPWWGKLLVAIFPAVGVFLFTWWWTAYRHRRLYGDSTLRLATLPGVIGGRLAGAVVAPSAVRDAEKIRLALTCTHTVGDGEDQKTRTVWSDEHHLKDTLETGETGRVGLPVNFVIPSDCLSSDEDVIKWKLTARAELPGVDYDAEFIVPVFRTEDSRDGVVAETEPASEYEQSIPLEMLLAEQGIEMAELGTLGGYRIASPAGRHRLTSVLLGGFTLLLLGVSVATFYNELWVFAAAFGFFGVILAFATLDVCLGKSELRITPVGWQAESGWWGFARKPKKFIAEDIESIEAEKSGSTGDKIDYRIVAYLPGEERVVLVRGVRGPQASRQLVGRLREIGSVESDAPELSEDPRSRIRRR